MTTPTFEIVPDERPFVNVKRLAIYEDADGRLFILCRHHVNVRRQRGTLLYCETPCTDCKCQDCKEDAKRI